jgi:excisionase family DNA binding protein
MSLHNADIQKSMVCHVNGYNSLNDAVKGVFMNRIQVPRREALAEPIAEPIVVPTECEHVIREMAHTFGSVGHGDILKFVRADKAFQLTPELALMLSKVFGQISRSSCSSIVPMDKNLSTFEAAKVLGVSRPFLIGSILDKGLLPYERVGKRGDRRIKMKDLLEFQRMRSAHRSSGLDELAQMNAEFIITAFDPEEEE